jgi:hypothetical protein
MASRDRQLDRNLKLLGTADPAPERLSLRAGPVTAEFEAGGLRYIRHDGVEAVRAISFLIRDKYWGTPSPRVANLRIQERGEGFRLTFDATCSTAQGELAWTGEVTGLADGTITFTGVANPASDFETCRTGFVVLHPIGLVTGQPVAVTDVNGTTVDSVFPADIDPYMCFTGIRGLRYGVISGVDVACRFDGSEPWEMEDQRNWTDASFKTYVRPMSRPFPYVIPGGSEDRQVVRLSFEGDAGSVRKSELDGPITVTAGAQSGDDMPAIGLSAPVRWLDQSGDAALLVRDLGPQCLHVRFDPAIGPGRAELSRLRALADATAADLMLEITVSDGENPETELRRTASLLTDLDIAPAAIAVVPALTLMQIEPTDPSYPEDIKRIYAAARKVFASKLLGGGVFGFFAELNRNRPPPDNVDFVTNLTSALVHAADDESVMETLDAVPHLVRAAQQFAPGKPYWLGPSNIGLDECPYGPTTDNPDNARVALARMDPRHRGLFGAAWTAGLIIEAAKAGVSTVITAALVGELGVAYTSTGYPQPGYDGRAGAAVYPLYHVLRGFAHAAGKVQVAAISEAPGRVRSIAYRDDEGTVLWLANVTNARQSVVVEGASPARLWRLDEAVFEAATSDPNYLDRDERLERPSLDLGPYAVARIRLGP